MPEQFSFDIVSMVDLQEADNAVNQVKKEMSQRYDFKNSKSTIEFNRTEKKITINADDEYKLKSLKEMLAEKFAKRGISPWSLSFGNEINAFEGTIKQVAEIITGIQKEKAKEITLIIKEMKLKVQTQIQEDKIRVFGPKKDDLQQVIQKIKGLDFSIPLQFINYR